MEVAKTLFTASNMTVSYTADEEGYGRLPAALAAFKAVLPEGNGIRYPYELSQSLKMKAFGLHRRSTMWPAAAPSERVLIQAH
mgnify:FL=1